MRSFLNAEEAKTKCHDECDCSGDEVDNVQHLVFASKNVGLRKDELLVTFERCNIVLGIDLESVFASWNILIDDTIKLSEIW